ncbi:MAG: DUF4198 domain-containing protein [Desulfovibrionaceae bacterium]|nr:DUF4198 domain-containing protein [Desulfovibrionaceae bacterium]
MLLCRAVFLLTVLCFSFLWISPLKAQVTLLIPAAPEINQSLEKKERPPVKQPQDREKKPEENKTTPASKDVPANKEASPAPRIQEETDVLITLMEPFAHKGLPMDRPQAFTVLRFEHGMLDAKGKLLAERRDLLGDVEEIRYLGQKAWGANVGIVAPGLYQFLLETRPLWDQSQEKFVQHFVKVMVPVYGEDSGWQEICGQHFEIVPLTRPFGLLAPTLFRGQVLLDGAPLAKAQVTLQRINTDGQKVPTPWHEKIIVQTDSLGLFAFVANKAGWWCCQAQTKGAPLKGPDGQPKDLDIGAIFWFYADHVSETRERK